MEYYGKPYVQKEDYDLMEVVILNLGDARTESEYKILDLLNTLFSQEITPDEKKEILNQKFNIATTAELESEVQGMCNLGSAIENKGKEIGRAEGKKGLPVEMIADAIGFSIDEVKAWIG